jgi:beta-N-acetylglucosaminidase
MALIFVLVALLPVMTLIMTLDNNILKNDGVMNLTEATETVEGEVMTSYTINTVTSTVSPTAGIGKYVSEMMYEVNIGEFDTSYITLKENIYSYTEVSVVENDIDIVGSSAVNDALINQLTEVELEKLRKQREEEERQAAIDAVTAYACSSETYEGYFTKYMDLQNITDVTIDEMDYLIDKNTVGRNSKLAGMGEAYIKASQETGLNPIFLLCLTAQEAGWSVSDLHYRKSNPYSIHMLDDHVELGYVMGTDFAEGIVQGAIWINEHYYEEGQTTLYDFIYGKKMYSSSKDVWINNIVYNMNKCYKQLRSY